MSKQELLDLLITSLGSSGTRFSPQFTGSKSRKYRVNLKGAGKPLPLDGRGSKFVQRGPELWPHTDS